MAIGCFKRLSVYKYKSVSGRGKMLQRDEPVASVIQEALEGYALGHFDTQADVQRFLQNNPLFPKDRRGEVRHQRVSVLLNQPVYAGYVEAPSWGVELRVGQHEPIISSQTYQRIQDRLKGGFYAPRQSNLNEDFPLRGHVVCSDCGTPLTACWSKGSHKKYAYYLCPKRGCDSYGKSIARDKIEAEFEALIGKATPSAALFKVGKAMFKELWDYQCSQTESQTKALGAQLVKLEGQLSKLLERILDASVPTVIKAYEEKVRQLELDKQAIKEKMALSGKPASTFDETLRTAFEFLKNPLILWHSERIEDRQLLLKLTFSKRLAYSRKEGFRTANFSLPFKVLGQFLGCKREMARWGGFEPPTPRFVVWCSIQLSYQRKPGCLSQHGVMHARQVRLLSKALRGSWQGRFSLFLHFFNSGQGPVHSAPGAVMVRCANSPSPPWRQRPRDRWDSEAGHQAGHAGDRWSSACSRHRRSGP